MHEDEAEFTVTNDKYGQNIRGVKFVKTNYTDTCINSICTQRKNIGTTNVGKRFRFPKVAKQGLG